MLQDSERTCSICNQSSNITTDTLLFGDWMQSHDIVVHYYCLLLSTHLPQLGKDEGGIKGFQIRDIRAEIRAASKRQCCFCSKFHASIRCNGCKDYFHLSCGRRNFCQFEFWNEFHSYCRNCTPLDEYQRKWEVDLPSYNAFCHICRDPIGLYNVNKCIHSNCCGQGFVHTTCMQKYALSAGYYLRCLWCGNPKFRDHVRLHGVFVPDRDAQWERQKNAFRDLHSGHKHCDMPVCRSPKGRDYSTKKWSIILCQLCGSTGAHNPYCIPGKEKTNEKLTKFKCSTCSSIETTNSHIHNKYDNNTSLYMHKFPQLKAQDSPAFNSSEDDSISSCTSVNTVLKCPIAIEDHRVKQKPKNLNGKVQSKIENYFTPPQSSNASRNVKASDESKISDLCMSDDASIESDMESVSLPEQHASTPVAGEHIEGISVIQEKQQEPMEVIETQQEQEAIVDDENFGMQTEVEIRSPMREPQLKESAIELYEFDNNLNCLNRWFVPNDVNGPSSTNFDINYLKSLEGSSSKENIPVRANDIGIFKIINDIIAEANEMDMADENIVNVE